MPSIPYSVPLLTHRPKPHRFRGSFRWRHAYRAAVANAALFFLLSILAVLVGKSSLVFDVGITTLFFIGSIFSFYLLVRAGAELAAVSFYVFGTGILFGLGTTLFFLIDDSFTFLIFSQEQQLEILPKINLVNAVSVLIVLISAWPLCRSGPPDSLGLSRWHRIVDVLSPLRLPLLLFALPIVFLKFFTFPLASNLLLRGALGNLMGLVYLAILIGAMRWSKLSSGDRFPTIVLFATVSLLGFVRLSKQEALLPFVALAGGMLLDGKSRKSLTVFAVASVIAYFVVIAPTCNAGRNQPGYSAERNSIPERIDIVSRTWSSSAQGTTDNSQLSTLSKRIIATPYQAFLIERYDSGANGNSITDAWQALIPRVFWRDKPNITRFGTELDALFYNRDEDNSLAPTYSAEAYWNGGWFELVLISILLGLELGWFTKKWNSLMHGSSELGIFFFSIPVILSSFWIETWVVATYVGGFLTLVILIKAVDFGLPIFLTRLANRRRIRPAFGRAIP